LGGLFVWKGGKNNGEQWAVSGEQKGKGRSKEPGVRRQNKNGL